MTVWPSCSQGLWPLILPIMSKIQANIWSTSEKKFMILLACIIASGDIRFSKLMVYTCFKLKAAVEAIVEVEVNFFHKSSVKG